MGSENSGGQQKKGGGVAKWLIGGCLLVVIALGGCGFCAYKIGQATLKIKDETRTAAIAKIGSHDEVLDALGQPLDFGMVNQINITNNKITMSLPVTGKKKSGRVNVLATNTASGLQLDSLTVTVDGTNKTIVIVGPNAKEKKK